MSLELRRRRGAAYASGELCRAVEPERLDRRYAGAKVGIYRRHQVVQKGPPARAVFARARAGALKFPARWARLRRPPTPSRIQENCNIVR